MSNQENERLAEQRYEFEQSNREGYQMKEITEPTPRPWRVKDNCILGDDQRLVVCNNLENEIEHDKESFANADFIVKAVNAHDDLLEACKDIRKTMLDKSKMKVFNHYLPSILSVLDNAIQKAEGK